MIRILINFKIFDREYFNKTKSIEGSGAGRNETYFLSKRSGLLGIVVKRFEFNWRRRLGAVTQKLSR